VRSRGRKLEKRTCSVPYQNTRLLELTTRGVLAILPVFRRHLQ